MRGLLLAALLDGPAHGYELMRRLEECSGGQWRPSPGSVYPLLQQLEDQALVRLQRPDGADGRKVYALTAAGRREADPGALARLTAGDPVGGERQQLHAEVKALHLAAKQIGIAGEPAQAERAAAVVRAARQALYQLLAEP
jgi:DNA-binding PadR family transcriptional regulator